MLSPELWSPYASPSLRIWRWRIKGIKGIPGERVWEALVNGIRCRRDGIRAKEANRRVWKYGHIQGRHNCFRGKAVSTLMDLEAICKADQLLVVFQLWQMVPGWTNVTFPWINNLRKIDKENRQTCPLLDYLNISFCSSFPKLLTKYTGVSWKYLGNLWLVTDSNCVPFW